MLGYQTVARGLRTMLLPEAKTGSELTRGKTEVSINLDQNKIKNLDDDTKFDIKKENCYTITNL